MSISELQQGVFWGDSPYIRWGTGQKKMIIFPGGPGNTVPGSFMIQNFYKEFDPFREEYSIYLISRKKNQPKGYSTRDMSNDYAGIIKHDFGGHVELVLGMSYGGMIAQHFAADHPQLFDHLVIAIAAHRISEIGRKIDYRFAELLSQGKTRTATASMVDALYPPGIASYGYKVLFWLMGGMLLGSMHDTFKSDVMVEAQAELEHESRDSLSRIQIPVLIICGAADVYFPRAYAEEMAGLIKGSILKLYQGKGHMATLEDAAFAKDVFEFISQNRREP
jgi:pimeloyl-ACP methyl ester carboxylesterase